MKILNFSHAISPEQLGQLRELGLEVAREVIIGIQTNLDLAQPLEAQVVALVEGVGWTRAEWETTPFVTVLPSHPDIAVLVAAEIEGRSGHLPAVLRRKPVKDDKTGLTRFEVVEITNPYELRNQARKRP